jgi:hypothetical protein
MPTYLFSIARRWWDRVDVYIEADSEEDAREKLDKDKSFLEEEIDPATLNLEDWDEPDLQSVEEL